MITEEDGTDIKQLLGKVIDGSPAVGLRAESVLRKAKRSAARQRIAVVTGATVGVVAAATAGIVVAPGAADTETGIDTAAAGPTTSPSSRRDLPKPDPAKEQQYADAVRGAQREFLPPGAELRKFDVQAVGAYQGAPNATFKMVHLGTGQIADAAGVTSLQVAIYESKTEVTCAAAKKASLLEDGDQRKCEDLKLTDGSPARLIEFRAEKGFVGLSLEAMRLDGTYVEVRLVNTATPGADPRKTTRPELTIGKAGMAKIAELPGLKYK